MEIGETVCENVEWVSVALDTDHRQVLMNTVMYLRIPYKKGNFLIS